MTKSQELGVGIAAVGVGAALVARGLRTIRAMDFRGRSVLITGGSRGLGLLLARELGKAGTSRLGASPPTSRSAISAAATKPNASCAT
jgi:hypothetical protein